MIGAITGDIVGSVYEWHNIKTKDFPFFSSKGFVTDDSIMTIALADSILNNVDYEKNMVRFYQLYPNAGYGGSFRRWCQDPSRTPYNSWGNGAAMRISHVGFAYDSLEEVLKKAEEFTVITHNHEEGIRGAKVTAGCIFLARAGETKDYIREFCESMGYPMKQTLDEIRPSYRFDVSCQGTVPWSVQAFLEGDSFEDCIRNAISIGGDSDTLACITGGIAEAFYRDLGTDTTNGVSIKEQTKCYLDSTLEPIVTAFVEKYVK